jgi:hypothetical protein
MLLQMHVIGRSEPQALALCACQRRDAMTLPGFNAETSLYSSSVHYRLIGASVQAGGVVPQQLSCGPCLLDSTGACVRNCIICTSIGRLHLCHPFPTLVCDPSACPSPPPVDCDQAKADCRAGGGIIFECTHCPDYPMDCTNCACHYPGNHKCCFICT